MSNREVMQQALEALKSAAIFVDSFRDQKATQEAITALLKALEQPEQEPVISAWSLREVYFDEDGEPLMHRSPPAAEPEQEPVAYYHPHKGFYWAKPTHISAPTAMDVPPVPLYVKWKAAQRPWVGLDEDEIRKLYGKDLNYRDGNYVRYAMAVEAKLKERNT